MINDQFKPRPNSKWTSDRITSAVLIAANIIPLVGVAFYQWDLVNVMLLYWLENILIGFMNIVRIVSHIDTKFSKRLSSAMFFTVHYGMFCLVHGMLLFTVLNLEVPGIGSSIAPMDFVIKANESKRRIQLYISTRRRKNRICTIRNGLKSRRITSLSLLHG